MALCLLLAAALANVARLRALVCRTHHTQAAGVAQRARALGALPPLCAEERVFKVLGSVEEGE